MNPTKIALTLLFIALSPLVVAVLVLYGLASLVLHLVVWAAWGERVLFVYSDSPVWRDRIEADVLPRLPASAIVVDWSRRREWNPWSLTSIAFRFFGGGREFNPMGIVVRPLRWTRCFRFWKPFRQYKHGKPEALIRLEESFFAYVAGESGTRTREGG